MSVEALPVSCRPTRPVTTGTTTTASTATTSPPVNSARRSATTASEGHGGARADGRLRLRRQVGFGPPRGRLLDGALRTRVGERWEPVVPHAARERQRLGR